MPPPPPPPPNSPHARGSQPTSPADLTQSQRYVVRAGQITDELTELYSQLAVLKGSELRTRHATLQSTLADPKMNITTAREQASIAVQHYTVETMKITGEIDGLKLALEHCDRVLRYMNNG